MYATAAWNNGLQPTVSAHDDGSYVGQQTLTLNTSGPTFLNFDDGLFDDVDEVVFNTCGRVSAGFGGSGTHMAVDDMLFHV